ncbi:MAG: HTH domain-containing protein [Ruminococcaceae bacterium]|nr:HTH domain-containing protein [Oscillospiraceae bacterium]
MADKLNVSERRTRILEYLLLSKQTTRKELSEMFGVCINTIVNDIEIISSIAPIYTKQGNGGGIYILPEYRSYKNYLTDSEENFLYDLIQKVDNDGKRILCGIITKFTKNPMQEHSSFHNSQRKEETDCMHN